MGTTINGVFEGSVNLRRRNALKRLQEQLKSGKKPDKQGNFIALTESDIKRIEKEIEILKSRI